MPRVRVRSLMVAVAVAAGWLGLARATPWAGFLAPILTISGIQAAYLTRNLASSMRAKGDVVSRTMRVFLLIAMTFINFCAICIFCVVFLGLLAGLIGLLTGRS